MTSRMPSTSDRSDRAPSSGSSDVGLAGLVGLIVRRKALFAALVSVAFVAIAIIHFWLPVYEAHVTLVFQNSNSSSVQAVSARLAALGVQEDEMREMERYVNRLNTRDFFRRAAADLRKLNMDLGMFHREMRSTRLRLLWGLGELLHLPMKHTAMSDITDDEELADILDSYTSFRAVGLDRISLDVRSGDQASVSIVANVVADAAAHMLLSEGLKDLDDAHSYVEKQAEDIEQVIHEIEEQVSRLRVSHGIAGDDSAAASQAAEIKKLLNETSYQVDENQSRITQLEEKLAAERKRDPSSANASIDPDNRYGIPRAIAALKRTNGQIQLRQAALKQSLQNLLKSDSVSDGDRIFELRKRMEFQYKIYEELKKQAFELEMRRIGANNKVRVSDHVRENGAKRTDNLPMKLAIALILSIFCGLPIAVVWEMARPGVRSGRDLTDAGLAYLGGVPSVVGRFAQDKRSHGPKICRFDSDNEVAMAFVQIRSRLLYLSDRKSIRTQVLGVVSPKMGDGKSFFARNLAACFGHMGRKTLLIDCDLRRPSQTEFFTTQEVGGLGEVLSGTRKFGEVVQRQVVKGVDFVAAGHITTNITDLFADAKMGDLVRDLREVYDQIVLDTPSLIAVPDTPLILRVADVPLLVASVNGTSLNDLEVSLDRIHTLYSGEVFSALNRVEGGKTPLYLLNNPGGMDSSGQGRRAGPASSQQPQAEKKAGGEPGSNSA